MQDLLVTLKTSEEGLSEEEAKKRLHEYGKNSLKVKRRFSDIFLLIRQFSSPVIILLLIATALALILHDRQDAVIILTIVFSSGLLDFFEERKASLVIESLMENLRTKTRIRRRGKEIFVHSENLVPGDIIHLCSGDVVAADMRIISQKHLFVNEVSLTGESVPVEKKEGRLPEQTALNQRKNSLFMGTHIEGGEAIAVVVRTGKNTELGQVVAASSKTAKKTAFEENIASFGYQLWWITSVLIIITFSANFFLEREPINAILFSLALAVGMTPQLLPASVAINLAKGAQQLSKKKVITRHLNAIENFGSMNIFCTDKTGTLTEGTSKLYKAVDSLGEPSQQVKLLAALNAKLQTSYTNAIDRELGREVVRTDVEKLDELPFDSSRRRLSILVSIGKERMMITKGAFRKVLSISETVKEGKKNRQITEEIRGRLLEQAAGWEAEGYRVLAVAVKEQCEKKSLEVSCENEMMFMGFVLLEDPLKPHAAQTINDLKNLGIGLKVITGDSAIITRHIASLTDLNTEFVLTGEEIEKMSDRHLIALASSCDLYAEVDPLQKARIIKALKYSGATVGYMGDGINDIAALHEADVSISVDQAVDSVKNEADFVMLEKELTVLHEGIISGRTTFLNTMKYLYMASSANLGNMISMAFGSLFLPFLPLLPNQILLANFLTDIPAMAIAFDRVDGEALQKPCIWNLRRLRHFMISFGSISSVFDLITFGVLFWVFRANEGIFHTGWFLESVISAICIIFSLRTRRSLLKSRPHLSLLLSSLGIMVVAAIISLTSFGEQVKLPPLPLLGSVLLIPIILGYIASVEWAKKRLHPMMD